MDHLTGLDTVPVIRDRRSPGVASLGCRRSVEDIEVYLARHLDDDFWTTADLRANVLERLDTVQEHVARKAALFADNLVAVAISFQ